MSFALPPDADAYPASRYVSGTTIATARGNLPVETIRPGDLVRTILGADTAEVAWTGRRVVDCARHPDPVKVWPVRIAAHAFGAGVPEVDLYLSPDHAVYVDRVLIPVRLLIDGAAIRQELARRIAYHHIELVRHDVMLVNGLPTESGAEPAARARFSRSGGVIVLHPDFSARPAAPDCRAPLVSGGTVLAAVRKRLAAETARRRTRRDRPAPRNLWLV